jgi:hypothetical protein
VLQEEPEPESRSQKAGNCASRGKTTFSNLFDAYQTQSLPARVSKLPLTISFCWSSVLETSAFFRFAAIWWATPLIPLRRETSSVDGNIVEKVQRAAVPNLDIAPTALPVSPTRLFRRFAVSPIRPFALRRHAHNLLAPGSLSPPPGTRHNQGTFHRAKPKTLHDLA